MNHDHETPENEPTPVIKLDAERERLEQLKGEVSGEVDHHHEMETAAADRPEQVDREELKKEALRRLEGARNAEARVKVVATILDTYGADALLGVIFPEIGDAAVSATVLAYMTGEAALAKLPTTDVAKIAWYQLVDFAIGSVPVLGDVGDYFYKASKYSAELFTAHREKLVAEAIEAGVPQEEIEHLLTSREQLEYLAKGATKLGGQFQKKAA